MSADVCLSVKCAFERISESLSLLAICLTYSACRSIVAVVILSLRAVSLGAFHLFCDLESKHGQLRQIGSLVHVADSRAKLALIILLLGSVAVCF